MPRLAIVIPVLDQVGSFENGLVSVLTNRPADCEVIAVFSAPYSDPYQLANEVRLVHAAPGAGFAECANLGVSASEAPFVHVLAAGCEVAEGWTDKALVHFRDPRVGSVAPLVIDAVDPRRMLSAGVQYSAGGTRRDAGRGALLNSGSPSGPAPIGPCRWAGFYRRAALELLHEPWSPLVGETLADVDLALRLAHAGYTFALAADAVVRATAPPERRFRQGFRAGRQLEYLFWRNAPVVGWGPALALHPWTVLAQAVATLPSPAAVSQVLGRLFAMVQSLRHVRHYLHLASLAGQAQFEANFLPLETPVDPPQAGSRPPVAPRPDAVLQRYRRAE